MFYHQILRKMRFFYLIELTGFYCHAEQSEASGLQMRIMYTWVGRDSSLRSEWQTILYYCQ